MDTTTLRKLEKVIEFNGEEKAKDVIAREMRIHINTVRNWYRLDYIPNSAGHYLERIFEKELRMIDIIEDVIYDVST